VCRLAWDGDPRVTPRTQASLAVSADGEHWTLLNASPDLRAQLAATPALHPRTLRGSPIDQFLGLKNNIAFLREMAIGLIIIVFLVFEPDGLAHRWRQIKAYWKLYPFSH
jgi:hypothetical protein